MPGTRSAARCATTWADLLPPEATARAPPHEHLDHPPLPYLTATYDEMRGRMAGKSALEQTYHIRI
eukprot:scaffold5143_cov231-Pinguiococcus_pyrenoidosus.AAC.3